MAATLKLQTIHCAKTGISLVNISDSKGINALNALLSEGRLKAGNNAGNIFLSEDERAKLKAAKQWNGTNYRWCYRDKSGAWHQFEGWTIGQHNINVLKDVGMEADKSTLSKGQVGRRQYVPIGTTGQVSPKETVAIEAPSGPLFGGNPPKETVDETSPLWLLTHPPKETVPSSPKETAPVAPKEVVNSSPKGRPHLDVWPKPNIEFGKQGGHQVYVSRAKAEFKLTLGQAKALWAEGRRVCAQRARGNLEAMLQDPTAVLQSKDIAMSLESKGLIYGDQPKAETWHSPGVIDTERIQDFEPQPKAETTTKGGTVRVKPEALKGLLAGIEDATVVGFADGYVVVSL